MKYLNTLVNKKRAEKLERDLQVKYDPEYSRKVEILEAVELDKKNNKAIFRTLEVMLSQKNISKKELTTLAKNLTNYIIIKSVVITNLIEENYEMHRDYMQIVKIFLQTIDYTKTND